MTVRQQAAPPDDALRLYERAPGAIQETAQAVAEVRYTPRLERPQQAAVQGSACRGRSLPAAPSLVRVQHVTRTRASAGAWPR